jgi:hypothetical protein
MALQIMGEVKYNPARDIVYIMPAVMQSAMEAAIDKKPWPDMQKWMTENGIDDEELSDGFHAYGKFLSGAAESYGKTMTQALDESGWLSLRWQVRVAVGFYMVYILSGTVYKGAQQAVDDEHKIPSLPQMIEAGVQLDDYVRLNWWQRWKYRRNRKKLEIARIN